MPTACIQLPGSKISLEFERLVVAIPESDDGSPRETRRDIPLRDLERMVMGEGVSATMPDHVHQAAGIRFDSAVPSGLTAERHW